MSDPAKKIGVALIVVGLALAVVGWACNHVPPDHPVPDRAATPGTAELVAVTPDGVKVWKVTGPGLVVPYVFAESKTGHLSSR